MKRTSGFESRFFLLCGSNVLLQGMSFVYRILISRYAGSEGLGVYRLASALYSILHTTCLSGITLSCTRFTSAWKAEKREGAVNCLVRLSFVVFGFLFLSSSAAVWFGRDYIGGVLFGDRRIVSAIPILLICLMLTGIENIFKAIMIGLDRIDNAAISELSEQLIRIVSAVIIFRVFHTEDLSKTAVLIFCASVISEIFSAAIMSCMYLSMLRIQRSSPPSGYWRDVCKTIFPVSASSLCSSLIASAGSVLLPKRLIVSGMSNSDAVSELGILSGVAAPIMTLPMALISSLSTVSLPEISARFQGHDKKKIHSFSENILRTTGLIALPFTALLVPLAPTISRLFFYQPVRQEIFILMGLSCILCYYQIITCCFLNGCGKQGINAIIITCGEVLQLILVWYFTAMPQLRIYGYVIAQCIAPFLVTVCNLIVLRYFDIIKLNSGSIMIQPLLCAIMLLLWSRVFFSFYSGFLGQWKALIMTVACSLILYLFLLRIFDVKIEKYLSKMVHLHTFHPMFY